MTLFVETARLNRSAQTPLFSCAGPTPRRYSKERGDMPTTTKRRGGLGQRVASEPQPEVRNPETFLPVAESERQAKRWCQSLLHAWSLDPLGPRVLAVLDDLLANALQHGIGSVQIELQQRAERIWIGVRDDGPGPMREGKFPPRSGDHGLGRVAHASHIWGVHRHHRHGTTVWSELDMIGAG